MKIQTALVIAVVVAQRLVNTITLTVMCSKPKDLRQTRRDRKTLEILREDFEDNGDLLPAVATQ